LNARFVMDEFFPLIGPGQGEIAALLSPAALFADNPKLEDLYATQEGFKGVLLLRLSMLAEFNAYAADPSGVDWKNLCNWGQGQFRCMQDRMEDGMKASKATSYIDFAQKSLLPEAFQKGPQTAQELAAHLQFDTLSSVIWSVNIGKLIIRSYVAGTNKDPEPEKFLKEYHAFGSQWMARFMSDDPERFFADLLVGLNSVVPKDPVIEIFQNLDIKSVIPGYFTGILSHFFLFFSEYWKPDAWVWSRESNFSPAQKVLSEKDEAILQPSENPFQPKPEEKKPQEFQEKKQTTKKKGKGGNQKPQEQEKDNSREIYTVKENALSFRETSSIAEQKGVNSQKRNIFFTPSHEKITNPQIYFVDRAITIYPELVPLLKSLLKSEAAKKVSDDIFRVVRTLLRVRDSSNPFQRQKAQTKKSTLSEERLELLNKPPPVVQDPPCPKDIDIGYLWKIFDQKLLKDIPAGDLTNHLKTLAVYFARFSCHIRYSDPYRSRTPRVLPLWLRWEILRYAEVNQEDCENAISWISKTFMNPKWKTWLSQVTPALQEFTQFLSGFGFRPMGFGQNWPNPNPKMLQHPHVSCLRIRAKSETEIRAIVDIFHQVLGPDMIHMSTRTFYNVTEYIGQEITIVVKSCDSLPMNLKIRRIHAEIQMRTSLWGSTSLFQWAPK